MHPKLAYFFVGTICFLLGILVQQWLPGGQQAAAVHPISAQTLQSAVINDFQIQPSQTVKIRSAAEDQAYQASFAPANSPNLLESTVKTGGDMLGKVTNFIGDGLTSLGQNIIDNPGTTLTTALGAAAGAKLGGGGAKAVLGAVAGGAVGNLVGRAAAPVLSAAKDKITEWWNQKDEIEPYDPKDSAAEEYEIKTPEEGGYPLPEALEKSKFLEEKKGGQDCAPDDITCMIERDLGGVTVPATAADKQMLNEYFGSSNSGCAAGDITCMAERDLGGVTVPATAADKQMLKDSFRQ